MTRRTWRLALVAIVAVGVVVRVLYARRVGLDPLNGDALEFEQLARGLSHGNGYVNPNLLPRGISLPTADKPPLYPLTLAGLDLLGFRDSMSHHASGIISGSVTVAVIGATARTVSGRRGVGLLAAAIAALYPPLVMADGSLRSESLFALLVAGAVLATVRYLRRPRRVTAVIGGACVALATLTRGEALVLVVLLPLAVGVARPAAVRATHAGLFLGVLAVLLVPWLVRCWTAFDRPVLVSTNTGGLIAGANCHDTYYGPNIGQWSYACLGKGFGLSRNEAVAADALRARGVDYARAHASRLPAVLVARVGRTLDLRHPFRQAQEQRFYEGRDLTAARLGVVAFWVLAALALAALLGRIVRRADAVAVLAPVIAVAIVTVTAYGWPRFRVGAEPAVVVLAALALARLEGPLRRMGPSARGSA